MLPANVIILEYVCPLLGCIFANLMFSAPFKDVRTAVNNGTLGSLNPTPWAAMTGNCTGWVTYSYLLKNQFIFWANAPGLVLSIWFNLAASKLQYCDRISTRMKDSFVELLNKNRKSFVKLDGDKSDEDGEDDDDEEEDIAVTDPHSFAHLRKMALDITFQRHEASAAHELVVVAVVTVWLAIISLISFLNLSLEEREFIVGIAVNINLLFFYGAPLSTIFTVIKTRDSSSIHRWTMLMNTGCAIFWTGFGFGIMDYFIIVPNGIGCVLGFIQMFLRLVVPSSGIHGESYETRLRELHDLAGTDATRRISRASILKMESSASILGSSDETRLREIHEIAGTDPTLRISCASILKGKSKASILQSSDIESKGAASMGPKECDNTTSPSLVSLAQSSLVRPNDAQPQLVEQTNQVPKFSPEWFQQQEDFLIESINAGEV